MLSGDFARNLKKLNPNLRIYCGDDANRPATLYYSKYNMGFEQDPEDYIEICGVDKNYLPEDPITDGRSHIVKGGWRRVLNFLIARKLVDKQKAEKLFQTGFDRAAMMPIDSDSDPILRAIKDAQNRGRGLMKIGDGEQATHYRRDDMMDIGRMIHKQKNRG